MKLAKILGIAAFGAVLACMITFDCQAQPPYGPAPLNPQQQAALQQILGESSAKVGPLHDELARKEAELQGELDSTDPDQGRITALSREIGDLRGKILSEQAAVRGKLAKAGIPAAPAQGWNQPYGCPQGYAPCWGGANCWGGQGGWGGPCWGGNWGGQGRGHYGYHHGPRGMGPGMMNW